MNPEKANEIRTRVLTAIKAETDALQAKRVSMNLMPTRESDVGTIQAMWAVNLAIAETEKALRPTDEQIKKIFDLTTCRYGSDTRVSCTDKAFVGFESDLLQKARKILEGTE